MHILLLKNSIISKIIIEKHFRENVFLAKTSFPAIQPKNEYIYSKKNENTFKKIDQCQNAKIIEKILDHRLTFIQN